MRITELILVVINLVQMYYMRTNICDNENNRTDTGRDKPCTNVLYAD